MGKSVMIFGLGDLGEWVLHFLARKQGASTIIACDKRDEFGAFLTHFVAAGAGTEGYCKKIEFEKCDVLDVDATAELINKYDPDLVYSGMALLSWKWARFLPPEDASQTWKITATLLPGHLVLPYKLMQAVKKSGSTAVCVQNSMPDVVNPILWRCGLGVLTGAGNIQNIVSEIRRLISSRENVPIEDVTVYQISEHCVGQMRMGRKLDIPYFLKVMIGDKDITNKYDAAFYTVDRPMARLHATPGAMGWFPRVVSSLAASATVETISAIVNDTNQFIHVPGPNGLIGGYPVRLSANSVKIELPQGVTMEKAIKINADGARFEGVEEIKDDGTLVVTDEAYEITKRIFGIECKEIPPQDIESRAKELLTVFRRLGEKHGFEVPDYWSGK